MSTSQADIASRDVSPAFITGVGAFFATMYFVQGIGEPTAGLISQPVRSLLRAWGESPGTIAAFMAILALPWSFKPVFGMLSDFVPIFGSRRRSYLLMATASASLGLLVLYLFPVPEGARWFLFFWLLLPTIGVAFGDVLVDALMVETGQPLGLTGRLQSVQWTAIHTAGILSGAIGGYVAAVGRQDLAFLLCGLLWGGSFVLALVFARERPREVADHEFRDTARALRNAWKLPAFLPVCVIVFLWSFSPSSGTVFYIHLTETLGFGEQAVGNARSIVSLGAAIAAATYGVYCRRIKLGWLVHVSIGTGILATSIYWDLASVDVLYGVSFVVGVAYMTGLLIQLDIAARIVPLRVAATLFALLMALSNFASTLGEGFGGQLYEWLRDEFGSMTAFRGMLVLGIVIVSACWVAVPKLRRDVPQWWD